MSDLEEEVKKYKEELDKALKRASAQPEDEVWLSVGEQSHQGELLQLQYSGLYLTESRIIDSAA